MTQLAQLLDQALRETTFRVGDSTTCSVKEFRDALEQAQGFPTRTREILSADFAVVDVSSLVDCLRSKLSEFLGSATERIGHSFNVAGDTGRGMTYTPNLTEEIDNHSSLEGLAKGLTHAAAVLGSDRATELVDSWAGGEPWEYKILVILSGLHIGESIELGQGLRMYTLPTSSDLLPVSLPTSLTRGQAAVNILGHTLLEIDAATRPAFFAPCEEDDARPAFNTWTALGECRTDAFFLALSLVCGQRVALAWTWLDYCDAGSFTQGRNSTSAGSGEGLQKLSSSWSVEGSSGVTRLSDYAPPVANLSGEGLLRAWELRNELQRRIDTEQRFQIAVSRWTRAATPGVMNPDRVIDLRVALETLYLDSDEGELGFRLSLTGARHLRDELEDRRDVRKSLADFYRLASRVVHGTPIKRKDEAAALALVDRATDLCREGILKIVEQRQRPKWIDVLLE